MRMMMSLVIISALSTISLASGPSGAITLSPAGSLVTEQPLGISYHVTGLSGSAGNKIALTCEVRGPNGNKSSLAKTKIIKQGSAGLEADMLLVYGGDFGSTDLVGDYSAICTIEGSGLARATAAFKVTEY